MIHYIVGDATQPTMAGDKIIVHVCNDIGKWGKGFVLAISKRWIEPELKYKLWHQSGSMRLGMIQPVKVDNEIIVINMVAQHGIKKHGNRHPIRYDALEFCLEKVDVFAKMNYPGATIHMPKIGAGLAGGEWSVIEQIIQKTLREHKVYVYALA
jgi:O-acetyl-ADP-ribose deacetylase (regulator of RNase III)